MAVSASVTRELKVHPDLRGNVRETFRASWFDVPPIKQLVRSESNPQTLRGMHLHRKQFDIWHFVSGRALVRLHWHDIEIEDYVWADAGQTIVIPPGVSHGFYTESGCVLLYALTEEYTGEDEFTWYPVDGLPAFSRDGQVRPADFWPRSLTGLRVSERDLRAPRLEAFDAA